MTLDIQEGDIWRFDAIGSGQVRSVYYKVVGVGELRVILKGNSSQHPFDYLSRGNPPIFSMDKGALRGTGWQLAVRHRLCPQCEKELPDFMFSDYLCNRCR